MAAGLCPVEQTSGDAVMYAAAVTSVAFSLWLGSGPLPGGTIAFSSLAPRGWDIYLWDLKNDSVARVTDHPALDYNANWSPDGNRVAFVSERDGNLELYLFEWPEGKPKRLTHAFALDDHPAWSPDGRQLVFSSTRCPSTVPGRGWNQLFILDLATGACRRLSDGSAADYSPDWSPDGQWIAFASGSGRAGHTDIFVMRPDGTDRRLVLKNGGWPSFAPDSRSLYFHSNRDGLYRIWQVQLDGSQLRPASPEGVEAYTPRAARSHPAVAFAAQRNGRRQIAVMDLQNRKTRWLPLANEDCWNPSLSPDGARVLFHKRSAGSVEPVLEYWSSPFLRGPRMARIAGAFPAFSPDGRRVAFSSDGFSKLTVADLKTQRQKHLFSGEPRSVFAIFWAKSGDWLSFSHGRVFEGPRSRVDIERIRPDGSAVEALIADQGNCAFPAFSPDGKFIVYRSGQDGHKNLYIFDLANRTRRRLTHGPWTDTMCDWSPTSAWIVFASDRAGAFDLYLLRPDGTGLRKLIGGGGRNNHPHFSPDGKWVVFASQRAGYSAEEVSLPFQFQPYGDIFAVSLDGKQLWRLTHNGFEEGTPAWGPDAGDP
ncbi:MAG: hypothetical protein C4296_02535 [Gemmataceae bacterium]